MRRWKRRFLIGRLTISVMGGGRYRFGARLKRAGWPPGYPVIGGDAGLGICVVRVTVGQPKGGDPR